MFTKRRIDIHSTEWKDLFYDLESMEGPLCTFQEKDYKSDQKVLRNILVFVISKKSSFDQENLFF